MPPVPVWSSSVPRQPPWYDRLASATSWCVEPEVRTMGPPVSPMHAATPSWPVTAAVVPSAESTVKVPVWRSSGAHSVVVRP